MEEVNPQSGKESEEQRDIILPIELCFQNLSIGEIGTIVILYSLFRMTELERDEMQKNLFFLATIDDLYKRGILKKGEDDSWYLDF